MDLIPSVFWLIPPGIQFLRRRIPENSGIQRISVLQCRGRVASAWSCCRPCGKDFCRVSGSKGDEGDSACPCPRGSKFLILSLLSNWTVFVLSVTRYVAPQIPRTRPEAGNKLPLPNFARNQRDSGKQRDIFNTQSGAGGWSAIYL